jgi:hypothetical protein
MLFNEKKENKIFLIYKEIQMGAVAKSYIRKGFLIHEEGLPNCAAMNSHCPRSQNRAKEQALIPEKDSKRT